MPPPPPPPPPPLPAAAPSPAVTPADLASLRRLFSPTLHLLPLTPALIPALVRVVNASYRLARGWAHEAHLVRGLRVTPQALRAALPTPTPPAAPAAAAPAAAAPGIHLILDAAAPADAAVLACVDVRVTAHTPAGPAPGGRPAGYVGLLTVRHAWQGRGLGRWLLRWAERVCRRLRVERVLMCVLDRREALIRWYQRCGFRVTACKVDARPFIEGKGEELLVDCCFVLLEKVFAQEEDEEQEQEPVVHAFTAAAPRRPQIQVNSTS